jgi:hypothetical protein
MVIGFVDGLLGTVIFMLFPKQKLHVPPETCHVILAPGQPCIPAQLRPLPPPALVFTLKDCPGNMVPPTGTIRGRILYCCDPDTKYGPVPSSISPSTSTFNIQQDVLAGTKNVIAFIFVTTIEASLQSCCQFQVPVGIKKGGIG